MENAWELLSAWWVRLEESVALNSSPFEHVASKSSYLLLFTKVPFPT
jgi:hypothetical protein